MSDDTSPPGPVVTVERTDADVMRWEAKMHWPGRTPMVGLGATIPDALRDVADSIEHDAIEEATAMWLSTRSAPTSSPLAGEAT